MLYRQVTMPVKMTIKASSEQSNMARLLRVKPSHNVLLNPCSHKYKNGVSANLPVLSLANNVAYFCVACQMLSHVKTSGARIKTLRDHSRKRNQGSGTILALAFSVMASTLMTL